MTPTPARLSEIRQRVEAATEGPWIHLHQKFRPQYGTIIDEVQRPGGGAVVAWSGFDAAKTGTQQRKYDARFIAHAREDIPWLLSHLEALARENARLRDDIHDNQEACESLGATIEELRADLKDTNLRYGRALKSIDQIEGAYCVEMKTTATLTAALTAAREALEEERKRNGVA